MATKAEETAMSTGKDIILVADYHAENVEFRWFNEANGEERTGRYPTTSTNILKQVKQACWEVTPGGQVVWVMESTTGWARVKQLIAGQAKFVLANVLQVPMPPKASRRKTDKLDTARLLREYLNGSLPTSFQPASWWRELRRVVDCRQDLVKRQTAIKNWIGSLLHHETWADRKNLWSQIGLARLRAMDLPDSDRDILDLKLEQLEQLAAHLALVESRMRAVYDDWPEAQWVDQIRGIGMVTAVSLLAHIGPIKRFKTAKCLIAYAGLAPGLRQSDQTSHNGKIGGGGTDSHMRYLLIESTTWLREIPRYRPTYERIRRKRGKRVARIVTARLFLRSIHKMLTTKIRFNPSPRVQETAKATTCCSR